MNKGIFTIHETTLLAKNTYQTVLLGNTAAIRAPGQFVNIALPGFYLRRPISVCDWSPGRLTIVYKVVGKGTAHLASLAAGSPLDLLTGLGNGYDCSLCKGTPLLIAGGAGIPPMYALAKALIKQGFSPQAVFGFNTAREVFLFDAFCALGMTPILTTLDGSAGQKGLVIDALCALPPAQYYEFVCGPQPMLQAVYNANTWDGQFSFEERMGCGFGACMGCTCRTKYGHKRICKEGPVLTKEEIVW